MEANDMDLDRQFMEMLPKLNEHQRDTLDELVFLLVYFPAFRASFNAMIQGGKALTWAETERLIAEWKK